MRVKKVLRKIRLRTWVALGIIGILLPAIIFAVYEVSAEPDPPVAYWDMDQTADNTCPGGVNDICDGSGNGNDMTNTGAVWQTTENCVSGSCIYLDGSSTIAGSDSASLSITGSMTLSAWVRPMELTASTLYLLFAKDDATTLSYALALYGDEVRAYIGSSSNYETTDSANLMVNNYYHISANYNSSAQTVDIYVNGVLQASTTTGTIPASISDSSNIMAMGNIDATDSITVQVSTDANDGFEATDSSWFTNYDNVDFLGSDDADHEVYAAHFPTVNLPQGASITDATFTFWSSTYGLNNITAIDAKLQAEDADDATALSGSHRPSQFVGSLTTASTNFDPATWSSNEAHDIDATDIVQEVVDRGSWASGNSMNFVLQDRGTTPSSSYGAIVDSAGDTSRSGRLVVNYSTGTPIYSAYEGYLDEVKIYSYNRSAEEIKTDLQTQAGPRGAAASFGQDDTSFLTKRLAGYWKMDEATDATRLDSSGNATTLSESASDSVVAAVGKFHNAADFELGDTEYLSAADNSALSITGSLTLAAWIRPETVSAGSYNIIAKWDGANESYRLFQNGDEIRIELDSAGNYQETTSANLSADTYYHVVGVYDSTARTAKIFVNGVEATSTTTGTIPASIGDDAGVFHIGAEDSTGGATGYYDGYIDEPRVYSRALSAAEISKLFNWAPSPFLHYRMDDADLTTMPDSSGNNNNGEMSNFTQTSWIIGKYGRALNFNGSNSAIDMYSANMASEFNGNRGSIMAWAKVADSGVWTDSTFRNILYAVPNNTDRFNISRHTSNDTLDFYYRTNGADILYGAVAVTPTTDWFHVALTWDTTTGEVFAYVNGEVVDTASGTPDPWVTPLLDEWTTIGAARSDFPSQAWSGGVDDVKFYNYPRTQGQIIEDMNAGHPLGGSPIGSQTIFWKFDEAQGTTAYNDVDLGTDGTVANALWKSKANCKINGCLQFDGTGDVVTIATASDDDIDYNTGEAFTGSAWVYSTTLPASGDQDAIIAKWEHDGATDQRAYRMFMDGDSTSSHFGVEIYDESANQVISAVASDNTAAVNTWYHVAFTFNGGAAGAAGDLKLYVNGNHVASNSANGSFLGIEGATTADFTVGDYDSDDSQATNTGFTGYIDDVKIYSDDLTAPQILIDMNANSVSSFGPTASDENTQVSEGAGNPPVIYWKLDENTGAGPAVDSSGNAYSATMNNMDSTNWVPGKFGSALSFDGSSERLSRADASYLDPATITWEMWFKLDVTASSRGEAHTLLEHDHSVSPFRSYDLYVDTDNDLKGLMANQAGTNVFLDGGTDVTANVWHHAAITWDGTNAAIYLDGKLEDREALSGTSILDADSALTLGDGDSGFGFELDGQMDEIKMFDYARTQAQIAYDYSRGLPIGWWKMDENVTGDAQTIYDSSGFSTNGTSNDGANDTGMSCTASGKYNTACDFDGTDDYIDMNDVAILEFSDTIDFTLAGWFNRDTFTTDDTVVAKRNGITNADRGYIVYIDDSTDKLTFEVCDATSACDEYQMESSETFTASGWNHFVIVWDDDSESNSTIYINGRASSVTKTGTFANIGDHRNTDDFRIGSESDGGEPFDGKIDDIRVYGYTLSASQAKKLFTENSGTRFGPSSGTP